MSPRLPLRELAEALEDPDRYQARLSGPPRIARGSPYFSAVRNAIFNLHKPDWSVDDAESYLRKQLEERPNQVKKAEAVAKFFWYVDEVDSTGRQVFDTRRNVAVRLSTPSSEDILWTGEIARLDLEGLGKYAGWRFESGNSRGWDQDPRMPLLQEGMAILLDAPTDEVSIGVYCFGDRRVKHTTYSASEISAARATLTGLSHRLFS